MLWSLIHSLIDFCLSKFRHTFIYSLVYLEITFLLLGIFVIISYILILVKNSLILKCRGCLCADTSMILLIINLRIKVWLKIIHLWDIVSFLLLLIKILYFLIDSIASLIWNNLRSSCILYNHSSFSLVLDTSQMMIYLIHFKLIILLNIFIVLPWSFICLIISKLITFLCSRVT